MLVIWWEFVSTSILPIVLDFITSIYLSMTSTHVFTYLTNSYCCHSCGSFSCFPCFFLGTFTIALWSGFLRLACIDWSDHSVIINDGWQQCQIISLSMRNKERNKGYFAVHYLSRNNLWWSKVVWGKCYGKSRHRNLIQLPVCLNPVCLPEFGCVTMYYRRWICRKSYLSPDISEPVRPSALHPRQLRRRCRV